MVFFVAALLNGYEKYITNNLFINSFHINVQKADGSFINKDFLGDFRKKTDKLNGIKFTLAHSSSQALMKKENYYSGVNVFAFDFLSPAKNKINIKLNGNWEKDGIVIGEGVASLLEVKKGDFVELSNIEEKKIYRVTGIFSSGMYEMDYFTIFMDISTYNNFFILPSGFESIGVMTNRLGDVGGVSSKIEREFSDFKINTVFDTNNIFVQAINTEKLVSLVIYAIVSLMFFIMIWLFMVSRINYHRKEFCYMVAGGIKRKELSLNFFKIFSTGVALIFIGGSFLSWGLIKLLNGRVTLPQEVYFVDRLYLVFDFYFLFYVFIMFLIFDLLIYFMFKKYFKNLNLEKELR
ncbi:MAG: ABC transporter permease [Candidatus Muiribacteriota bacterium]